MEIKDIVQKIMTEIESRENIDTVSSTKEASVYSESKSSLQKQEVYDPSTCLPDLLDPSVSDKIFVPNPANMMALEAMKKSTPARIAVWRAGTRYKTIVSLKFRADNSLAQDAVFSDISEEFVAKNNLEVISTRCENKDEYLTRPDLGKQFDNSAKDAIKRIVGTSKVVIYIADGLSTTAVQTNAIDTCRMIQEGLGRHGVNISKQFLVKYARVPAMDVVAEVTGADLVCVLIGERPGLITSESMSAYIAYKGTVGMPEANRSVVSNIHSKGMPALEAGAFIADLIKKMLDQKASGLKLK